MNNNNPIKDNIMYNVDNKTLKSHSDTDNISLLKTCQTDNLKVVIRIRPALPREMENDIPFRSIALISNDNKSCSLVEYLGAELNERERQREWMENPNLFQMHRFTFDHAFDMDSSQQEVYEVTAKPAVLSILEGYNSTIFAYGQTGTGKTYTMEGFTYNSTDSQRGIIPRSIEEIFNHIESFSSPDTKFMVRASYLQIYNESISDLLKPEKISLQIREDKKKGVFVEGLSEWAVRNPADIYTLLQRGAASRTTASTKMNDVSSRSHAVFMIIVEQLTILESGNEGSITQIKVGKLNLVDLAGSERIRVTGATGRQLEESKKINKSLSALGNVIYALTDNKGRTHIPYRDSKLTRLLEDSLGGNCKTTMMAMISPCHDSFNESLSTLHFSKRAKNIKNRPIINEDVDHRALIRQYEVELKKLRNELEEKNRLIHTNELVIQLEEERKRAEEDKQAAIYAFEQASKQYLQEREEKKRLEMKIQMMNSQVIIGGHKIEDTPQFRSALEERQTILLKEFDQKLQEFDKEKQQIEEDKVQVEHYKKFLQKLRDIMIALTTRLNERNETIDQLHEEIEAYEKIIRNLEDDIDIKIHRINVLEDAMKKSNVEIPPNTMPQIEKEKNYNRRAIDKLYIPYDYDRGDRGLENAPITMLNADEKIRELNGIIKEQDKELNIMKIVVQKFMNNQNEKININEMYSKYEEEYESVNKIRELEEYRYKLLKELDEKEEIIIFSKQENEELNEQIDFLDKNFEILNNEFTRVNSTNEDTVKTLDNLYIKLNSFEQIANQASNFSNNNSNVSTFQQNIKFIKSEINQILENVKQKNNSKNNLLRNSNSNSNNTNNLINPNTNENNMLVNNNNNSNGFYNNSINSKLILNNNEENSILNMANNRNKNRDTNNLITQINNNYNNFKEKRNKSLRKFNVSNNDPSLMNLKNSSLNKSAAQLNINISSENLKNTNNILKSYKFENIANLKNTPSANINNNSANPILQNSFLNNQSSNIKSYPNSGANSNNTSFIYQNANLNNIINNNNTNNPNNIPLNSFNGNLAQITNLSPSPGLRNISEMKKSFNSPPYDMKFKQGNINIVNNQTTNNLINNNNINNTDIFLNNATNPTMNSTANNYNFSKEKEKLFANSNYNTYNLNSNRIPGNANLGNVSSNKNNISEINNSGNPLINHKGNTNSQMPNNNNNHSNRNTLNPNYNPNSNYNFNPNYTNSTNNSNLNSNASKGNNRPESLLSQNSNSKNQDLNYHNNSNIANLNYPNNHNLNQMNYSELNNSLRLQKGSRENSLQENNFNISSPNQSDKNNNYANNRDINYNFNQNLNNSNQKIIAANNQYYSNNYYAQNDKNYNNGNLNEYTLGCTNDDNNTGGNQYQNNYRENNSGNNQFMTNNPNSTNRSNADSNFNNKPRPIRNKSESFVNKFINTNK